jgi:hypothetical protein
MIKQSFTVLAAVVLLLLAIALGALPQVQTESVTVEPSIVVFYEEGCPGCELMEGILSELVVGHENLGIVRYEINEPGTWDLLSILSVHYSVSAASVPGGVLPLLHMRKGKAFLGGIPLFWARLPPCSSSSSFYRRSKRPGRVKSRKPEIVLSFRLY